MEKIEDLVRSLTLESVGENRFRGENTGSGPGVIFGGQLMGQSIVAALAGQENKYVKTLHTVFPRGGSFDSPVDITVDPMHAGRTFASSTVTITQGDRLITRSIVLLSAHEPDVIRHADSSPVVEPAPTAEGADEWQVKMQSKMQGDVDIHDPDFVAPPDLEAWSRFPGAPDDPAIDQALIAYATDGFLIATAMLPHKGVSQAQAHDTLSTGVISHTITFHEAAPAREWVRIAQHGIYAGHGRAYGRGDIYSADGTLIASFVQDSMIKERPAGASGL
jgi:acyl-CoA thioesterase II